MTEMVLNSLEAEAKLQHLHIRVIQYAEEITFQEGSKREKEILDEQLSFLSVIENY